MSILPISKQDLDVAAARLLGQRTPGSELFATVVKDFSGVAAKRTTTASQDLAARVSATLTMADEYNSATLKRTAEHLSTGHYAFSTLPNPKLQLLLSFTFANALASALHAESGNRQMSISVGELYVLSDRRNGYEPLRFATKNTRDNLKKCADTAADYLAQEVAREFHVTQQLESPNPKNKLLSAAKLMNSATGSIALHSPSAALMLIAARVARSEKEPMLQQIMVNSIRAIRAESAKNGTSEGSIDYEKFNRDIGAVFPFGEGPGSKELEHEYALALENASKTECAVRMFDQMSVPPWSENQFQVRESAEQKIIDYLGCRPDTPVFSMQTDVYRSLVGDANTYRLRFNNLVARIKQPELYEYEFSQFCVLTRGTVSNVQDKLPQQDAVNSRGLD